MRFRACERERERDRETERYGVELKLWRSLCSPEKVPQDARVGDRRERERERERESSIDGENYHTRRVESNRET